MFLGALIFAALWCLIALLLRHYPETMAGYNTMPREKRAEIDIQKLGRLMSNVMFVGPSLSLLLSSCTDMRAGPYRSLSAKELMLSNCDAEKTLESPLDSKKITLVNPKGNQS